MGIHVHVHDTAHVNVYCEFYQKPHVYVIHYNFCPTSHSLRTVRRTILPRGSYKFNSRKKLSTQLTVPEVPPQFELSLSKLIDGFTHLQMECLPYMYMYMYVQRNLSVYPLHMQYSTAVNVVIYRVTYGPWRSSQKTKRQIQVKYIHCIMHMYTMAAK